MQYERTREVLEALEREGVVTPRMLHRMKRSTVRPQDRADAFRLADYFGFEED